jgi:hypothetical protein
MSERPILRRSAVATHTGERPTRDKIVGMADVPSPLPRYSHRLSSNPLATTQSIFPSPLKSPIATEVGTSPAGSGVRVCSHGPKPPGVDALPRGCADEVPPLTECADSFLGQLDLDLKRTGVLCLLIRSTRASELLLPAESVICAFADPIHPAARLKLRDRQRNKVFIEAQKYTRTNIPYGFRDNLRTPVLGRSPRAS